MNITTTVYTKEKDTLYRLLVNMPLELRLIDPMWWIREFK